MSLDNIILYILRLNKFGIVYFVFIFWDLIIKFYKVFEWTCARSDGKRNSVVRRTGDRRADDWVG